MTRWVETIRWPGIGGLMEILVLALGFYFIIQFFRGTRGAQVLTGLVVFIVGLIGLTRVFHLDVINWLLQRFSVYIAVALVIIFQPEIRRALAELGKQHPFNTTARERSVVESVVQAALWLSERKIGALLAIEREIGTGAVAETGRPLDGLLTPELLAGIFYPHTPLHDGGVVIRGNRIVAARCIFPLTQQDEAVRSLGTRHRAALGLTEETDALAVVVSEETGTISIALNGRLSRGLDEERLRRMLSAVLHRSRKPRSRLRRLKRYLDLRPSALAPEPPAADENGEEDRHASGT